MKSLSWYLFIGVLCGALTIGCKKKQPATAPAAGSGSAMMGSGSAEGSGSAAMGSGSADEGSGSAMAGSGSAAEGSGSAMAGSGSAAEGSGSAMAGSGSAAEATPPAEDPEGKRHWNCKKACKLAVSCKTTLFKAAKECDQDCTHLEKDKGGKYARGSAESAAYYTCIAKAADCAAITTCDHDVAHVK